ncbi:hypothetical protein HZU77_007035 [Neisseriaceae bacterium TC5R-5]|nr:hypothetical protein [Neisseriaceae bacterium TC5R-5]
MNTVEFNPRVTPFAGLSADIIEQYRLHQEQDEPTRAYLAGCIEGELAFALASHPHSAVTTFYRCQQALLQRLGLVNEVTPEQRRLKGWIVGLFGCMTESLSDLPAPPAEASPAPVD